MELRPLALSEVVEIHPSRHSDERGYFSEIFRQDWFCTHVANVDFVQENQSLSAKAGTIRGLHFQTPPCAQGKLVRCLAGAIFDVAVDLRAGSPCYGQWAATRLTTEKGNQLWVPEGFAHGFCTLEPDTVVCYKVTAYYSPEHDEGVAWDDKDIGVEWPNIADPTSLSAKDQVQPRLADLPACFPFEG
jgi:dTDP-4-dehydrorhamnose 3,5-epimerase